MWFRRMELEDWFDTYQYEIEYDIGESAVKTLGVKDLNIDLNEIIFRYGYHKGRPDLRKIIASSFTGFSPENIIVTTGASEANFVVIASLVKPGDHVIVEHPNYPSNYEVPRSLGCDVDLYTLRFENEFRPLASELEAKITPRTKLISLTHPNNPTGSKISREELQKIIDIAESKDIHLLFDETYREMDFENSLPPAATLSPKVISISSLSKSFGLPGLRFGWLATQDQDVLRAALAVREQVSIANNALSEEIALRVLMEKDRYVDMAKQRIHKNRGIVADWINQQENFEWVCPEAGVVGFPRIKNHVDVEPEKLYRHLVEQYKTFVVPGRCFEMDPRHFRLGFGGESEKIKIGLNNLNKALAECL
ncbi:MAG: aminotransferase class I/II-fold pyridoxal phosphate-dependent enzyme [Candidatus Aminicenantes bacterium]|nr:aminotransferase class I/II-fold pyridoxal phosphate-dependent enzyme [Candidatus Aminicenantes bacterium]